MRASYLFTSESVSEGHPDKVCGPDLRRDPRRLPREGRQARHRRRQPGQYPSRLRDAVHHEQDRDRRRRPRPAVPRIHGKSVVDRELITEIARGVVKDIGYDQNGFSYHGADVEVLLHGQSPDIAMGVDAKKKKSGEEEGAGDQGMMFGYACTESEVYEKGSYMPAPIFFAHRILQGAVREAPQRPAVRPAAGRQEPGHGALCRRQAGRLHQGRGLDPAQREEPQRQEVHARPDQAT